MSVLIEPRLAMQFEWDSTKCPACKAPKWKFYPFCRSCSIKLQCAHMMQPFVSFRGRSSIDLSSKDLEEATLRMFEHYDRAQDFLAAVLAGRAHARRTSHKEEL